MNLDLISNQSLLLILIAYLIGSIPFSIIISKIMRLPDPRSYGSKNPGTTNILRSGSKVATVITLFGDISKGWIPVYLSKIFISNQSVEFLVIISIASFIGHIYPIFLKFKGGKGVATAFGVLIAIQPIVAFITLLTWLTIAFFLCYSSLASLVSAFLVPIYYILGSGIIWNYQKSTVITLLFITSFLFYQHIENIYRLINGKENQINCDSIKSK